MSKRFFTLLLLSIVMATIKAHTNPLIIPIDSAKSDFKLFKRNNFKRSLLVSGPLLAIGVFSLKYKKGYIDKEFTEERNEHLSQFESKLDNYMAFAPISVVYLLDVFKAPSRSSVGNQTLLFLKSELIMIGITKPLKKITHRTRPSATNNESFPSGHTAQAFLGASLVHKEFGKKSIWYSIGGYAIASSVGVYRVLNNKHYVSDVLVGASIGVLSTNLAYLSHKYRWGKKPNFSMTVTPTYQDNNYGFQLQCIF